MGLARDGMREIIGATVALAAAGGGLALLHPWAAILPIIPWIWVLSFFRDPARHRSFAPHELCAPADGTVTEITRLDHADVIGGPAWRIGIFLSIFDVHANRSPCAARVRSVEHRPGGFLDARHPESGRRNESNTLVLDPQAPIRGPIVVRQVAGKIARRIVCHAGVGDELRAGERFGMIKFGSRTELLVPALSSTEIVVTIGSKVRAGLTVMLRQPADPMPVNCGENSRENHRGRPHGPAA
jgi:phosphatidylserine decarboxylase